MNNKTTKRALLFCFVSVFLCFTMLLGTTYAWFTDSVTSGINTIVSGNLDIKLEYSKDLSTWTEVTSTEALFDEATLWEPGHTEVVYLKASNVGSLALKYVLSIDVADETPGKNKSDTEFKLSDHILYGVVEDVAAAYTLDDAGREDAVADVASATKLNVTYEKEFNLDPLANATATPDSDVFALVVYMPEDTTNDVNHNGTNIPKITFGVSVYATQLNAESDSFGTDYDKDAKLPVTVSDATELAAAIANGENVVLSSDVTLDKIDLTAATGDVVIDANGKTITATSCYGAEIKSDIDNVTIEDGSIEMTTAGTPATYAAGIKIVNGDYAGKTITIKNAEISMANNDWAYGVNIPGGVQNLNLVIDGCTINGAIPVQCWGDNNTITIKNSKLDCNYNTTAMYTSNCIAFQDDGATSADNNVLTVENCEFVYSGVDAIGNGVFAITDDGTGNTVTITGCTYGTGVVAP